MALKSPHERLSDTMQYEHGQHAGRVIEHSGCACHATVRLAIGLGLRRPNPREAPEGVSKEPFFGAFFAQKYV